MSLRTDCLVAVTGLFPKRIHKKTIQQSRAIPGIFAKRIGEWIEREDSLPFEYVEQPKDLDARFDDFARDPTNHQPEIEGWMVDIGLAEDIDLEGDIYVDRVAHARAYAVKAWPKFSIDEGAGKKILPLSTDDAAELWSVVQVIEDPRRILTDMDSCLLTGSQSASFRECFPDLYLFTKEQIEMRIINKRAKDEDWILGRERDAIFRILKGEALDLMAPPPPEPPPAPKRVKVDEKASLTQGEMSARSRG